MWDAHEGMGWWMIFGSVFWIGFTGLVVYLFATLVNREPRPARQQDTPLEIAKRRLASGEISEEEYERLRDTLSR